MCDILAFTSYYCTTYFYSCTLQRPCVTDEKCHSKFLHAKAAKLL